MANKQIGPSFYDELVAAGLGGAVFDQGTLTVLDSTLTGNSSHRSLTPEENALNSGNEVKALLPPGSS